MKIYLSGPMTGYPDFNFAAFDDGARRLRAEGYEVISPHEFDLDDGFDPSGSEEEQGFDLRAALERDVEAVLDSDAVALLPGWEDSPGCAVEIVAAASKGAPARPIEDFLRRKAGAFLATLSLLAVAFTGGSLAQSQTTTEPDDQPRVVSIQKPRRRAVLGGLFTRASRPGDLTLAA